MKSLTHRLRIGVAVMALTTAALAAPATAIAAPAITYHNQQVEGVKLFYREAGPVDAPTVLLLHGFPSSSHMYRDLIPALAGKYHVVAPDYPGFGYSDAPDRQKFAYTFDHYAHLIDTLTQQLKLQRYAIYVMDYGAPVGFRLATQHPERITAIIVQNGNAYEDGIGAFWDPLKAYWKTHGSKEREALRGFTTLKSTQWQYTDGVSDVARVNPDSWTFDQALLDRPGNADIQLDLFYDYRTNLPLYPSWQEYFRKNKPPTLVVWGKNDKLFLAAGGDAYKRDNPDAEIHQLDTGHFALETHGAEIASLMIDFLDRHVK